MIQLAPQLKILLAVEPVDFRKGIDSLCALCKAQLDADPFSGIIFVFRNRAGTALKLMAYDGTGYWLSRKRQNTYLVTQFAAEAATIVDPTHPLFGQTLPILRASRHHLKNLIVLALPDGRERRIPVSITNLVESPAANTKSEGLISVRTLMPLVELTRAMVAPQEDYIHGTAPRSTAAGESSQSNQSTGTRPTSIGNALEQLGSEHSESIGPVSGRADLPNSQDRCGDRDGGRR